MLPHEHTKKRGRRLWSECLSEMQFPLSRIYIFFFHFRWALLCLKWQLAVRRTRCDQPSVNHNHGHNAPANQPMLMISDRQSASTYIAPNNHPNLPVISSLTPAKDSQLNNLYYPVLWLTPALLTVAVLVSRFVDADELLGEKDVNFCFSIAIMS